jgi:uncharacterized membrane protein
MSNRNNKMSKAEKRKMEKLKSKKRNQKMMIMAAVLLVIIVAAVYVVSMGNTDDDKIEFNSDSDVYEQSETKIKIPVSSITTKASFYKYDSDGVDISYFAVKGDDGEVHVAVDACDVCFHAKEGYEQVGDEMRCRNCGLTFPIIDIGEKNTGGGCWPSFIPMKINEDSVIIEKSDLDSKRFMFE